MICKINYTSCSETDFLVSAELTAYLQCVMTNICGTVIRNRKGKPKNVLVPKNCNIVSQKGTINVFI